MHSRRNGPGIAMRWLLLLPVVLLMVLAFHQLLEMPPTEAPPPATPAAQGVLTGQVDALPPEVTSTPRRHSESSPWCWTGLADSTPALPAAPAADSRGMPLKHRVYRRSFYLAFPPGDMPG